MRQCVDGHGDARPHVDAHLRRSTQPEHFEARPRLPRREPEVGDQAADCCQQPADDHRGRDQGSQAEPDRRPRAASVHGSFHGSPFGPRSLPAVHEDPVEAPGSLRDRPALCLGQDVIPCARAAPWVRQRPASRRPWTSVARCCMRTGPGDAECGAGLPLPVLREGGGGGPGRPASECPLRPGPPARSTSPVTPCRGRSGTLGGRPTMSPLHVCSTPGSGPSSPSHSNGRG